MTGYFDSNHENILEYSMPKTQKELMQEGQLYLAFDHELLKERDRAKQLCWEFNNSRPSSDDASDILKKLLPNSPTPHIERPFNCDYGYNIKTGRNFYANHGCTVLDGGQVIIGNDVMLAPGVVLATATHPLDEKLRVEGYEIAKPICIGDSVWIGANTTITDGVTIGQGAVIAAGALVNKNVLPYTVNAGVPARQIKDIPRKKEMS